MLLQTVAPSPQDSERRFQSKAHCLFAKNVVCERNLLTQLDEPLDIGLDFQQIGQDREMPSGQRPCTASPKSLCKQEGTFAHDCLPVSKGPSPEGRPTPVHFQQHDVERVFVRM